MTYRYCSAFKKFRTGLLDHQPRPIDPAVLWYLQKLHVLRSFSFVHLCWQSSCWDQMTVLHMLP